MSYRFTNEEDMAIIKYITVNKRYLLSSGVQVWKVAEESNICPGRSYQSMKERFRKVLVKNLRKYNLEKELCAKILEFTRANKEGKAFIFI